MHIKFTQNFIISLSKIILLALVCLSSSAFSQTSWNFNGAMQGWEGSNYSKATAGE